MNETKGTVAFPKDFQTPLWDFAGEDDALRIVLDVEPKADGMPLTQFTFRDDEQKPFFDSRTEIRQTEDLERLFGEK